MLKLYGFAVSNYYNMVKLALLEKGVPFEEVPFFAGKTPESRCWVLRKVLSTKPA